jgi:hypothetical protein
MRYAAIRYFFETASDGDYLITYEESGLTTEEDPGSRCGLGDDYLAEIETELRKRGLTLVADDEGLVARTYVEAP